MKKRIGLLFLLCFMNKKVNAQLDDALHFYAGAGTAVVVSTSLNHYINRPTVSCLTGIATGVAVGAAKEYIWDGYFHLGVKNNLDFFTTSFGAVQGGMAGRVIIDLKEQKRELQVDYFDSQLTDEPKKGIFRIKVKFHAL